MFSAASCSSRWISGAISGGAAPWFPCPAGAVSVVPRGSFSSSVRGSRRLPSLTIAWSVPRSILRAIALGLVPVRSAASAMVSVSMPVISGLPRGSPASPKRDSEMAGFFGQARKAKAIERSARSVSWLPWGT